MNNIFKSCLVIILISVFLVLMLAFTIVLALMGWGYYKLTKTNDLAVFASKKLSKPNKYTINIESFKNTFPIIIGNNVKYKKISDISTLTIDINELVVYPDYLNPKIGTHSFLFNNASMILQNKKFLMDANNIFLSGKYSNKNIEIASSTWKVFGGKIYLSGDIDTKKRPSPYKVIADLIYVRLEDILVGTKHRGLYTGKVYGKLDLQSTTAKKSPLNGKAKISITNGTYYKPELIIRINKALRKIGLHNTLKDFAENVASSSFSLNGDFIIKNQSYETRNAEIKTPWSLIKFSGIIGPKSAINGTFVIKVKDYSEFTIKVKGSNSKNLNYKISDSDKARLASIFIREVGKATGKQIKEDGKKSNKKFNANIDKLGKRLKKLWD